MTKSYHKSFFWIKNKRKHLIRQKYQILSDNYFHIFNDMNGLIKDPVAEHLKYKKRSNWGNNEIRIFIKGYVEHNKNFKKNCKTNTIKEPKRSNRILLFR